MTFEERLALMDSTNQIFADLLKKEDETDQHKALDAQYLAVGLCIRNMVEDMHQFLKATHVAISSKLAIGTPADIGKLMRLGLDYRKEMEEFMLKSPREFMGPDEDFKPILEAVNGLINCV